MKYSLKNINWMLLVKRLGGFTINYFILFIPVLIASIILFFFEMEWGLLNFFDHSSGLLLFSIMLAVITFPATSIKLLYCATLHKFLIQLTLVVPVFVSFLMFDFLTALIFCNDIGSIPFKLIIVDKCGRRAARWRIIIRTFLKYLTVFLCPILLLLPLFNRRQACLHELLSGAYKVEKTVTYYPPVQTQGQ